MLSKQENSIFPKIMAVLSLIAIAGLLSGCGLSSTYQYDSLKESSNYEVCNAVNDPRKNMAGSGWTVRAEAAARIASERGISCTSGQVSTPSSPFIQPTQVKGQKLQKRAPENYQITHEQQSAAPSPATPAQKTSRRRWSKPVE